MDKIYLENATLHHLTIFASNRCDGETSKQGTCRCKTDSDCKAGAECKYAFPILHTTFNPWCI